MPVLATRRGYKGDVQATRLLHRSYRDKGRVKNEILGSHLLVKNAACKARHAEAACAIRGVSLQLPDVPQSKRP
jgi:hypothetical protein